jgi:hypothetical protein
MSDMQASRMIFFVFDILIWIWDLSMLIYGTSPTSERESECEREEKEKRFLQNPFTFTLTFTRPAVARAIINEDQRFIFPAAPGKDACCFPICYRENLTRQAQLAQLLHKKQ